MRYAKSITLEAKTQRLPSPTQFSINQIAFLSAYNKATIRPFRKKYALSITKFYNWRKRHWHLEQYHEFLNHDSNVAIQENIVPRATIKVLCYIIYVMLCYIILYIIFYILSSYCIISYHISCSHVHFTNYKNLNICVLITFIRFLLKLVPFHYSLLLKPGAIWVRSCNDCVVCSSMFCYDSVSGQTIVLDWITTVFLHCRHNGISHITKRMLHDFARK
jgi:hypothetical protein